MSATVTTTPLQRVAQRDWQVYDSQALARSGVVNAKPCVAVSAIVFNNSGSARYFHIYDSATVPADATVPAVCPLYVAPGATASIDFAPGRVCGSGLSWASSTSPDSKTVTGSSDMWATVVFL